MLCEQSSLCEILYAVVQRVRESLDKRTAAGGTGFVQLHAVYGMVFDADAFHILSADIQDAVYLRIEKFSRIVVGDCLHFALVQHQSGLYQRLSVTCGAGADDMSVFRQKTVDFLNGADGCL